MSQLRRRLTRREVLRKRWVDMSLFHQRAIGNERLIACSECARKHPDKPVKAATFHIICDGPSRWGRCTGCGAMERIGNA